MLRLKKQITDKPPTKLKSNGDEGVVIAGKNAIGRKTKSSTNTKQIASKSKRKVVKPKLGKKASSKEVIIAGKKALAKIDPEQKMPDKVDKKTKNVVARVFTEEQASTILEALDSGPMDGAILLIYKKLLMASINTLPKLESRVIRSEGEAGAYQLNQTMAQIKESLRDIQSIREKGDLAKDIIERLMFPSFNSIAIFLVQELSRLTMQLTEDVSPAKRNAILSNVEKFKLDFSEYMQLQYNNAAAEASKMIS